MPCMGPHISEELANQLYEDFLEVLKKRNLLAGDDDKASLFQGLVDGRREVKLALKQVAYDIVEQDACEGF